MRGRKIIKCLITTMIISQLAGYPAVSYAEGTSKNEVSRESTNEEIKNSKGLLGYYFKDDEFSELAFINFGEKSNLINKEKVDESIQSIRWIGRLTPSSSGDYKFSTSSDKNIILQVNGETVINQGEEDKSISLEKDKSYELRIEYKNTKDSLANLQLFWSIDGQEKESIPQENTLSPDFSEKTTLSNEDEDKLFMPKSDLFKNKKATSSKISDTDKDGIPDEWEEKGYTFKGQKIVEWDDSYSEQGYKKYVSNPYKAHTVADPYTDLEKISGHMPEATKYEARDPMIAAYPAVGVAMENLIFTNNKEMNMENGGGKSKSVTDTITNINTVDISAEFSKTFMLSVSYSNTWENSTSIENTESESWSSQIGINTSEVAYLNANVRYYNTGTAPIYKVRPTSNFVLQNSGDSFTTITSGPNQIGNSLAPGDTYPKKGQAPISLDKANEIGTSSISIDADTLDMIQTGEEKLSIQTTQNKGQYGKLDDMGSTITNDSMQWDVVRTNIDNVSGSLILNLNKSNESLERRVVARNERDPEDKTPVITIREAIKKAFDAEEINDRLYYVDENGKKVCIDESAVNLIVDTNTQKEIENQLNKLTDKKVYNLQWKRGMNITLHVPEHYYDFETNDWNYTDYVSSAYTGSKAGLINQGVNGFAKDKLVLKPNTFYTARAYVKADKSGGDVVFYVDNNKGSGNGKKYEFKVKDSNKWQLVEFIFNTLGDPEKYTDIGFINKSNVKLLFDDVLITEWRNIENLYNGIILYDKSEFLGASKHIYKDDTYISDFNDKASSVRLSSSDVGARVYEHAYYGGEYFDVFGGDGINLNTNTLDNNISSIKFASLALYDNYNSSGSKHLIFEDSDNLNNFNDMASSIKVANNIYSVRLYEHASYKGRYIEIKGGQSVNLTNLNDKVSSVKILRSAEDSDKETFEKAIVSLKFSNPGDGEVHTSYYGKLTLVAEYENGASISGPIIFHYTNAISHTGNNYSYNGNVYIPKSIKGYKLKKLGVSGYIKEYDRHNLDDDILYSGSYLSDITQDDYGLVTSNIKQSTADGTFEANIKLN